MSWGNINKCKDRDSRGSAYCIGQQVPVERISHLGKRAVEGADDVETPNNRCCCNEIHVQFVEVYPLFPNALSLLRFINNAAGQKVSCSLDL